MRALSFHIEIGLLKWSRVRSVKLVNCSALDARAMIQRCKTCQVNIAGIAFDGDIVGGHQVW